MNMPLELPSISVNPDYGLEKDEAKQLKDSCLGHLFSNE
jgi:hypothetical protein